MLEAHHCLFGGGTAMALRYGEYRESVDIGFMVSHLAGYRALRQALTDAAGARSLAPWSPASCWPIRTAGAMTPSKALS